MRVGSERVRGRSKRVGRREGESMEWEREVRMGSDRKE